MPLITIHVDPETAQAFEAAPPSRKKGLEFIAEMSLRHALQETRSLGELLAEGDAYIAASGLSDTEIQELLKDVDEGCA